VIYQIICIDEKSMENQTVWSAFDQKLHVALYAVERGVSIRLVPEMGSDVTLLEWLANWQKKFKEQEKQFLILAEDPNQYRCLELSHPDLNFTYVSSLNEISNHLLPPQKPAMPTKAPQDADPPPVPPSQPEQPVKPTPANSATAESSPSPSAGFIARNDQQRPSPIEQSPMQQTPPHDPFAPPVQQPPSASPPQPNQVSSPQQGNWSQSREETGAPLESHDPYQKNMPSPSPDVNNQGAPPQPAEQSFAPYFQGGQQHTPPPPHRNPSPDPNMQYPRQESGRGGTIPNSEAYQGAPVNQQNFTERKAEFPDQFQEGNERAGNALKDEKNFLSIDDIIQISGEYACLGCNVHRMFLKGDKVKPCENLECIEPSAGIKLIFELF